MSDFEHDKQRALRIANIWLVGVAFVSAFAAVRFAMWIGG